MSKAQIEISHQVDDLVRDPKVMRWFRDMVAEYVRQEVEYFELKNKAEAERSAFYEAILSDERLCDEKAGPPGDGWEWRRESNFGTQYQPVVGWFPPATIEVPNHPWPWHEDARRQDPSPFTRVTYLPAKCCLLAACHDRHVAGNPRILTKNMIQGYPPLEVLSITLDSLETELAPALADVKQEAGAYVTEATGKTKTRKGKRGRRGSEDAKPLTRIQLETVERVGACDGDIAKAAKQLGKSYKTIKESYETGMKKLGHVGIKNMPKPTTQQLPHDKRGQVDLSEEDNKRF